MLKERLENKTKELETVKLSEKTVVSYNASKKAGIIQDYDDTANELGVKPSRGAKSKKEAGCRCVLY